MFGVFRAGSGFYLDLKCHQKEGSTSSFPPATFPFQNSAGGGGCYFPVFADPCAQIIPCSNTNMEIISVQHWLETLIHLFKTPNI